MKQRHFISATRKLGLLCLTTLLPFATAQSESDLSQVPLYTITSVPPNIFFLNDDSNSMDGETLINDIVNQGRLAKEDSPALDYSNVDDSIKPLKSTVHQHGNCSFANGNAYSLVLETRSDDCNTNFSNNKTDKAAAEEEWRVRFHEINRLYYDPSTTYKPWPGPNPNDGGKPFEEMTLESAWIEPMVGDTTSNKINLTTHSAVMHDGKRDYYSSDAWKEWCQTYAPGTTCSGWRYYYRDTPNGPIKLQWVKDLTGADRTNFANWFTYHRSRKNTAKFAIGTAVKSATGKRLGYGGINDVVNGTTSDIAYIANDNSATVYNKLYNTAGNGFTPLQKSLDIIGRYYETGEAGDDGKSPILSAAKGGACQVNNTILMTDGFYTGANTFTSIGNTDGDGNTKYDGPPYGDKYSNTLADIAMHYYERDLAPNLGNKVPTGVRDKEEMHQHMNTYTISFGLEGTINNTESINFDTDIITWPDPETGARLPIEASIPARIDDLFHAAVNGRGKYFKANDPEQLKDALNNIVNSIPNATNSSNTVAVPSFRLGDGDLVFVTKFDPADWSGTIEAFPINNGTLQKDAKWSSDKTLTFGTARTIITYDGATGIPFQWGDIETAKLHENDNETILNKTQVNYLRGNHVDDLRQRRTVLGDIVNSSPLHLGAPSLLYPNQNPFGVSGDRYSDFWELYKSRTAMVYVGANDGMLHGFRASDGKELLAYVPKAIFDKLQNLTYRDYNKAHKYFVDQTPTISDVYIKTSLEGEKWRSVLVSGLGAGGRGLFALDVTDPESFSEGNANKIALWEFTDDNDSDLGHTLAKPVIAITEDDKWVAIAGNGYGSNDGKAALFIFDLDADASDGWSGDYTKIAADSSGNNALFSPAVVDSDGNGKADLVYAGDLKGNLWRFDLKTKIAEILFTTKAGQPITSKPTVVRHPTQRTTTGNKPNMLVMFGTGKYLSQPDLLNTDGQSFYAVWDNGTTGLNRDKLVAQTLITGRDSNYDTVDARLTEKLSIDYKTKFGWYLDLQDKNTSTGADIPGERVISSATYYDGIVFFTTFTPSEDPCAGGGNSWFMYLKAVNGGPADEPIVDINNDRVITTDGDLQDRVNINGGDEVASGTRIEGGFGAGTILTINKNGETGNSWTQGSDGLSETPIAPADAASRGKRISWRELRRE